jgi:hypothetical protein
MKNIVFLFTFIVCSLLHAQTEFAPIGAKWYFDYTDSWIVDGYSKYEVEKDTTVLGKDCKKISVLREWIMYDSPPVISSYAEPILIHEENNVVYIHFENAFDTLFNFNAVPGNKWKLSGQTCEYNRYITVLDTGSQMIGNCVKKWQYVSWVSFYDVVYDTIIEGIGYLKKGYELFDYCAEDIIDKPMASKFRCYSDNNCNVNLSSNECNNIYVSIFESQNKLSLDVLNPTSDYLIFRTNFDYISCDLKIYDLTGKCVLFKQNVLSYEITNISFLKKGVYFVKFKFSNQEMFVKKLFIK